MFENVHDNACFTPTVSIEMIDAATSEEERQELIIKRTLEEDYPIMGGSYIITTPKTFGEQFDVIQQFGNFCDNLQWSFNYPQDTDRKPTLDVVVFEFSTVSGILTLLGRLNLKTQITSVSEHDASYDIHKAINRKGCFDIKMLVKDLSYTNLNAEPKQECISHYDGFSFKVDHHIDVVWSPYKGMGRFVGPGRDSRIPKAFILNDGLPTLEIAKQCYEAQTAIQFA